MSMASGSGDYGRFDELAEEFAQRYRRGERPSIQEYIERLPEMAEEIREMFPALVEVERAEVDARGEASLGPVAAPRLREVGDYRILREVGRGGMGVVYEAEQISLGRRVALKVLPGHVVGDRKSLERFRREAKAAARLHHTNIVPVFEVGRDQEVAYYAMQFIQGQGLEQVIDELARQQGSGRRPIGEVHVAPESGLARADASQAQIESAALPSRALGQMAESLLGGRLVTEVIAAPAKQHWAATDPGRTERFDLGATSDPVSGGATQADSHVKPEAGFSGSADASGPAMLPGGAHVSELDTSGRRQPYFRSVAQIGRQAAQGLAYAHARGIVHRDIKPSNLLLDTAGVVWITDFGLAKAEDDGLTQTGDILGTLRYMAPERFRGEGDARADVYALGLTLYELLTLRPAYDTSDRLKLIERIKDEEPPRPRAIDNRIPRDLETIVLKAIEKNPERRYQSADALAEDLRRYLADESIEARRTSAAERYWRWARRNPVIAVLGGVLTGVLVLVTVGSLLAAGRFATLADRERTTAAAERSARKQANVQATAESIARAEADQSRRAAEVASATAQAQTYRAMLSEVKALRAGHQPGWREEALDNLAQLAVMPTPRRDLVELRSEAVATIGAFDIVEVAQFDGMRTTANSLHFSADSQTLVTATGIGDIHLWDVAGRRHLWQLPDPAPELQKSTSSQVRFLSDGSIARTTRSHRVEILDSSGQRSARAPIDGGTARAVRLEIDRQGRLLAVGWDDGRINVYDTTTWVLSRSLQGNPHVFALSPDGLLLALVDPSGVQIHSLDGDAPPVSQLPNQILADSLAFSPDGKTLATVWGQSATLWDLSSGQERANLRGHKEHVTDLAFSPDGNWVATTGSDYTTRIWDARTGQMLSVLPGKWFMESLAFSPDGRFLAVSTVNQTGKVTLYELMGRRELQWLAGHRAGAQALAFHPTKSQLASGADDHAVIVWDLESARPLRRWTAHNTFVVELTYNADGSLLATGGGSTREVALWDAETATLRRTLTGHNHGIARSAMAFDPAGRTLATGDEGGMLILWDLATGQILRRETLGRSAVRSIAFLDEGLFLLAAEEFEEGSIFLFDLEGTEPTRLVEQPHLWNRFVIDSHRNRAIVADFHGGLSVVSLPSLEISRRLEHAQDGWVWSLALSHDARLLATGGDDGRVVLRDAETLEPLLRFPTWTGVVKDLAFDPTGRWLALAGADSDVGLWDLELVRDELAAVGLAWDQPAPAARLTNEQGTDRERSQREVPVILASNIDAAELKEAQGQVNSGVAAYRQARLSQAAAELRQASERLEPLRASQPSDSQLASLHGISLRFLASSLRDLNRPAEALPHARESQAIYESMTAPNPDDLYNMACGCALISALDDQASAEDREKLQALSVDYLRKAIESDQARTLPLISGDRDLDPLRDRADFRDMLLDAGFPRDPFEQPSPLGFLSLPSSTREELIRLSAVIVDQPGNFSSWRARGDFLARHRAWDGALADYRKAIELHPPTEWSGAQNDNIFVMNAAVVMVRAEDIAGYRRFARDMLDQFADSQDPGMADAISKLNLMMPPPPEDLKRLEALAQRAVDLGQSTGLMGWFQLVRGMSAYRSGELAKAAESLETALTSDHGSEHRSTCQSYLAMAEYRLGHTQRARTLLVEAGELIAVRAAQQDTDGGWHDLWIADMARREAEALINPTQAQTAEPARP